jgi:catechol 2,3-dioxygenase-like lactoylglutathione lyase family enzyme
MKFNKLIPELIVSDLKESINFYVKVLGFKIEYTREKFVFLSFQESQLMLQENNGVWLSGELKKPFGRGVNFQIEVKNVSPLLLSLAKNKCNLFELPRDYCYRVKKKPFYCTEFLVQDPDGYLLRFSQARRK